jgi:hypothetical protein
MGTGRPAPGTAPRVASRHDQLRLEPPAVWSSSFSLDATDFESQRSAVEPLECYRSPHEREVPSIRSTCPRRERAAAASRAAPLERARLRSRDYRAARFLAIVCVDSA